MELLITDVSSLCCPENVEIGTADAEMTERIRSAVMADLGRTKKVNKHRKLLRTFILAAAITALLTTAAFAISKFVMNSEKTSEPVTGHWTELDENGDILTDQKIVFPDAGMVFTFSVPEEKYNAPEFRAFWLPEGDIRGYTDEEGWTTYLYDNGDNKENLPFLISAWGVNTDNCKYVLNGDVTVLSEEEKDGWEIKKIVCDYAGTEICWDKANYVLMFNPDKGYMVEVGGTSDMETIEKIAENLEIRESVTPQREDTYSEVIGMIDIGRG